MWGLWQGWPQAARAAAGGPAEAPGTYGAALPLLPQIVARTMDHFKFMVGAAGVAGVGCLWGACGACKLLQILGACVQQGVLPGAPACCSLLPPPHTHPPPPPHHRTQRFCSSRCATCHATSSPAPSWCTPSELKGGLPPGDGGCCMALALPSPRPRGKTLLPLLSCDDPTPSLPLPHPLPTPSFHPDKSARMRGVIEYYIKGDATALDKFPGGSEPGTR